MPTLTAVDGSFVDAAPHVARCQVEVSAPINIVWEAILDYPSWVDWFPRMSQCHATSSTVGVGGSRRVKVGPLIVEERIVVFEPQTAWGFTALRTNLPVAKKLLEQIELEPSDGATLLTYTGAFDPIVPGRLAAKALVGGFTSAWTEGLNELDRYLKRSPTNR